MSDALLEAIQTRDVDRVAKLLVAGADPNEDGKSRYASYGSGREFPLQAAIGQLEEFGEDGPSGPERAGSIDSVVLLLRHGAKVKGWDVDKEGDPLFLAVGMNHLEAARLLLAHGADPNVRDNVGYSPLRWCAQHGYLEMARLLLRCGATKAIDEWGGDRPMTALGIAARDLQVDMVKLLLAYGADPQARDVDDCTPLDCLELNESAEDPADQERFREIRQLLGDPSA